MGVSRCVRGYVSLYRLPQEILAKGSLVNQGQIGKRCYLQAVSLFVVEQDWNMRLILSSQNEPSDGTAEEDERF